ncbi:MAG: ABC transporter substrate-binding protein [Firmicutes bacterium]|nr:ABC transporter substrate-binding protein [Bacillota bacterium]
MRKYTIGTLLAVLLLVVALGAGTTGALAAGTITIAYSEGGHTLDPVMANDLTSDTVILAVYDQLVTYGTRKLPDGRVVGVTNDIRPMLAERWTVSPDKKVYTFYLRKNVKFSNGDPVNADAVLFTLNRIANTPGNGSFLFQVASIDPKQVKKIDDYTVQIGLTRPNAMFLQVLAMYTFSILDPAVVKEHGNEWLASHAVGSGPFKLVSWDPANGVILDANKDYWQGPPKVDRVVMQVIPESSNRVAFLKAGSVDMAVEVPPKDVRDLRAAPGVIIRSDPSVRILYFAMNCGVKPFDNPKVRQAISYAIPYKQLINDVMYGQAQQLRSPVPDGMPGYNGSAWHYSYDLKKAKKLLTEAGYPHGFTFDFTLGSGFDDWEQDAVLIQASLAQIGVKMNITRMARPQFLQLMSQKKLTAFISKWTSFVNDPGYHLGFLLDGKGPANYINYDNPKVDALLAEASKETDTASRLKLYEEAQPYIVRDAPWAFLYQYARVVGIRKGVSGYIFYPDELIRFYPLSK